MAAVDALDADVAGTDLTISTANLVESGETRGFDLTIRVTRTVDSPLAIVDPDGPGGEPLRLVTAQADPAPFDLAFEFTGTVRTDPQGLRFWLDTTGGEPAVEFSAELAGDGEFAFPGGAAAIGVGDVEILGQSSVDLSAEWTGTIDDVNGDGRLAMFEPPAFEGGEETPGELTIPAEQLTTFSLAGEAVADIEFGSSLLGLDSLDPPSLTLDADLATAPRGGSRRLRGVHADRTRRPRLGPRAVQHDAARAAAPPLGECPAAAPQRNPRGPLRPRR
jgi:hypothetical protein